MKQIETELQARMDRKVKCKIRWIDKEGKPTQDENEAIGKVRCLGYIYPRNPIYKPEVSQWYPICESHKREFDKIRLCVCRGGRWEFRTIEERA